MIHFSYLSRHGALAGAQCLKFNTQSHCYLLGIRKFSVYTLI